MLASCIHTPDATTLSGAGRIESGEGLHAEGLSEILTIPSVTAQTRRRFNEPFKGYPEKKPAILCHERERTLCAVA